VLAPSVNFVLELFSDFVGLLARSETASTFIAIIGTIAAGLTGLVAALSGGAVALNAIRAAYATASVAAAAFNIALGPVLITIAAVGTAVALAAAIVISNWDAISDAAQEVGEAVSDVFGNIVQFFQGIFPNAVAALRNAFNSALAAVSGFIDSATSLFDEFFGQQEPENLTKALLGDPAQLQQVASQQVETVRDALSQVRELQQNTGDAITRLRAEQFEQRLLQDQEFTAMLNEMDAANREKTIEELVNLEQTKQDIRRQALVQEAKERNEAAKRRRQQDTALGKFLVDLEADIGKEKLNQTKETFNNLQKLTQSENAVLKGIGKAAAITQITIDTAQAATSAITAFSFLPIVGPALGLAAAGAIIAFGATQIAQVLSAQTGGVVPALPGRSQTRDSTPAMLQPGELVVPTQNFDEVVNAVAQTRTQPAEEDQQNRSPVRVELSLRDELVEFVEAKIIERRNLGLSVGTI
jgi:hypothetical protein